MKSLLVVGVMCATNVASADSPTLGGRVGLGVRTSSVSKPDDYIGLDDRTSTRAAVDGFLGVRFSSIVVGMRAGIATPLTIDMQEYDTGSVYPSAHSTIYPFDLGLSAQVDLAPRLWGSAWIGTTIAFSHATSPATHVSAISFSGDVPAASWRDHGANFGGGIALGYDLVKNQYGRFGVVVGLDLERLEVPFRQDSGATSQYDETCTSFTLGVSYGY